MRRVVIELSERAELGPDAAGALIAALANIGWQAEVADASPRRGLGEIVDVALRTLQPMAEHGLDALAGAAAGALVTHLRRRRNGSRRDRTIVLFGPDGRPLKRVTVSADDAEPRDG